MAMYNKSKFRFSETFNNANGKTSGSGFVGVIMGLTTTIAFCVVLIGWWVGKPEVLEIFEKVLQLGMLSAGLMGVRKISGVFMSKNGKTSVDGDNGDENGEEDRGHRYYGDAAGGQTDTQK